MGCAIAGELSRGPVAAPSPHRARYPGPTHAVTALLVPLFPYPCWARAPPSASPSLRHAEMAINSVSTSNGLSNT
jgi:hypothetical protein